MKKYLSTLLNHFLIWKQRSHYHSSIETLPLWNWWQLQDTNDFKYLSSKDNALTDDSLMSGLIYEGIFNEYIQSGGLGEAYTSLLELKRKWILSRSEWLVNDNRATQMKSSMLLIDIAEKESEMKGQTGVSKEDALIIISENLSSHITAKDITVKEFQGYLNYYSKKK